MSMRINAASVVRGDQVKINHRWHYVTAKEMPRDGLQVWLRLDNGELLEYAGHEIVEVGDKVLTRDT
jgi:hypothetical protein